LSLDIEMAARLIRQVEGCVLKPYQDSGGVWTIGFGTISIAGKPVTAETSAITLEEAEALLQEELVPTAHFVEHASPASAADNQLAACISFAYNVGPGAFFRSTLRSKWLSNDIQGAADQFLSWTYIKGVKSRGLENRREIERNVFLGTLVV
jgi:lysozyme